MKDVQNAYVTSRMVQEIIQQHYDQFDRKLDLFEAIRLLYQQERYLTVKPSQQPVAWSQFDDQDFNQLLDSQLIPVDMFLNAAILDHAKFPESLPIGPDVGAYSIMRFEKGALHENAYFLVFYVYSGTCNFRFNNERMILQEGELCIVAPSSMHALTIEDRFSRTIAITIRRSTFDCLFINLLAQQDLLSDFFRAQLYNKRDANYLLMSTPNTSEIKLIIKNLVLETHKADAYSSIRCISWINLLFSEVLRNYSSSMQFYKYEKSADFSRVIHYIQHNYRTLTLVKLAEFFHYQPTHLSVLIKKNTGSSFTELITHLKLAESRNYLQNTHLSIEKIAEQVGYNSADHFSAIFKKRYQCSPLAYRKASQASIDA